MSKKYCALKRFEIKRFAIGVFTGLLFFSFSFELGAKTADSLDELLEQVKQHRSEDKKMNDKRIALFRQQREQQKQLLVKAQERLKKIQALSEEKEAMFALNDTKIDQQRELLDKRMGSLRELFGHLTASAGDFREVIQQSIVSAQFPGRHVAVDALIEHMNSTTKLPKLAEIEHFWYLMLQEMNESGKSAKFIAEVIKPDGHGAQQDVLRAGNFNLFSQGKYLSFAKGKITELARQPHRVVPAMQQITQVGETKPVNLGIDPTGPTGGSLLLALVDSPTWQERFHQGGFIGYLITVFGLLAVMIAAIKFFELARTLSRVNRQKLSPDIKMDNPLGRVIAVFKTHRQLDMESLELKMAEAIIKERPGIDRFISSIKIIAMLSPLMGLLGTVTGMIITFQAIVIYGSGEPKTMAAGISSALVTTVLGLMVAIPAVLLHAFIQAKARCIHHILESQSAGLIAERSEGYPS